MFKPSGTVAADEYNLYRGMLVEPDPSGSCSLLYELFHDVWAQGDQTITDWVIEWFMHIIAYPGHKVDTSIAIRGGSGDGKSIVKKLMSTILGDMVLPVANHRMVVGDFNEAIMGKLITVLEEAAFAGDKAAFDKMKELITGDKVLINPKFKAPITVDNYSRLIVISNHEHFLHIKPGDRRYTVLESSPTWKGTNKFDLLLAQWANGGAARFVYDALNHPFRQVDDRKSLVISSIITTQSAVRQMAHSRSPLEKCAIKFLLTGGFRSPKLYGTEDAEQEIWELDKPLQIPSMQLEENFVGWLRDFDQNAARHEVTLHAIIGTLNKYAGPHQCTRPKGKKNASGIRPQLATTHHLPPRREAIHHAWAQGLLTDEEHAVVPPAPQPTLPELMGKGVGGQHG